MTGNDRHGNDVALCPGAYFTSKLKLLCKALGTNQQSKRRSLIYVLRGWGDDASPSKQTVKNGRLRQLQERRKPSKK